MGIESIVVKPDGTVHVRTFRRVGTIPLQQLLSGNPKETLQGLPEITTDTPVPDNRKMLSRLDRLKRLKRQFNEADT